MIRSPLGPDMTDIDEPVAAAPGAAEAGSPSSPDVPSAAADLGRALVCVVLVAGCVGSPGLAPLVAPFVPVLVALRLLRTREHAGRFLATATIGSLAAAASASASLGVGAAVVSALAATLIVPLLGLAHVRAARPDPPGTTATKTPDGAWPEPRIDTGQSFAIIAWVVAVLALLAAMAPLANSSGRLFDASRDLVDEAYAPYERSCADGGSLASQEDLCRRLLTQRSDVLAVVDDHGTELAAGLAALFAWGGALTAHLAVLARHRRQPGAHARPAWRLRELEVHWSAAYVLMLGLVALMARELATGVLDQVLLATGVGASTLGALLVLTQGVGLAAWIFTRRPTPRWYRVLLVLIALVASSVTIACLALLGMIDLAARPRRRVGASASVPGRGSGS